MVTSDSGTVGTKEISKRWPVEEGLEAGTTKQTKVPFLEEEENRRQDC